MKSYGDDRIGVSTGDPRDFASYDDLWSAFCRQLEHVLKHTFVQQYVADTLKPKFIAAPMSSMLHDLCMNACRDMHDGPIDGALYLGFIDTLGFATAIDSLAAIKKLVFDDKQLTMDELLEALDGNFEGKEAIRQMCLNAPKYGNNEPYADRIGRDIEEFGVKLTRRYKTAFGGELDIRYVTITAHVPFGAILGATPDGRKAGEPVAEGVSPSQGADRNGPTASLISISRTRASGYKERAARLLNMKLTPVGGRGARGHEEVDVSHKDRLRLEDVAPPVQHHQPGHIGCGEGGPGEIPGPAGPCRRLQRVLRGPLVPAPGRDHPPDGA